MLARNKTPGSGAGVLVGSLLLNLTRKRRSAYHFNVRQFPALVENRLLRAIYAKPREPLLTGLSVKPVGLLTGGRLGAKVDVHRAVSVLAQVLVERTDRQARGVEKEARRFQTIDGGGPELAHRHFCRNAQPVVIPAFQRLAAAVMKGSEVETAGAKLRRWAEIL